MSQPSSRRLARPLDRRPRRVLAAFALVTFAATAVIAPTAATAAVNTPFTFDQPAAATAGVVKYPASGATPTTLTGTGPDGATVRIETVDAGTLAFAYPCTTTVVNGAWSCDVTFDSFAGSVTAQRMEVSGGLLLPVEQISRTVVALTPPVFDGSSVNIVSSSIAATISGTVTALLGTTTASVRLTVEGDEICTPAVASDGTWSCSVSFGGAMDGPLDLAVTQTRSAGGVSGTSLAATTTYTLDTTGPTTPATFTTPAGSTLTVAQNTFALAGTAEASATVTVKAGSTTLCGPVTADAGGVWSCTATAPADGSYTMTIAQTDAVGNVSTAAWESVALTVNRSPVVTPPNPIITPPNPIITPPNLNIAPPPVFVTIPNLNIVQPTVPLTPLFIDLPGQLIELSTGLATDSPARDIMEEIVVTNLQGVFDANNNNYRYSTSTTSLPDIRMLLSLKSLYPDEFADVQVVDPATGEIEIREPTWSDMPWRAQVFYGAHILGKVPDDPRWNQSAVDFAFRTPLARPFGSVRDAEVASSTPSTATTTSGEPTRWELIFDQQVLTGDGTVSLSGALPTDLDPGEYEAFVRVVLNPDPGVPVPQNVEPILVSIPFTVVAEEAAPESGISPWLWAGVAALALGIIAIIVVMARNVRRRG